MVTRDNHNIKCSLSNQNTKIFAKALLTLSRIGEEIYMEFSHDQLAVRSINSAKSAYGAFTFEKGFFVEYHFRRDVRAKDPIRFKILTRTVITIFKPNNINDKQLDSCGIEVDFEKSLICFAFPRKSRVVHKHSIIVMDTDVVKSAYTTRHTRSHVQASAKMLTDAIEYFPATVEEVTLHFEPHRFTLVNFLGDVPDPKQASQIQLIMDIDEFDHYQIDRETAITFTLREIKGIIGFTSNFTYTSDIQGLTALPIELHFTEPGVPLILTIKSPYQYEASFVIATLQPSAKNTPEVPERQNILPSQSAVPQSLSDPPVLPGPLHSDASHPPPTQPPARLARLATRIEDSPEVYEDLPVFEDIPEAVVDPEAERIAAMTKSAQKTMRDTRKLLFGLGGDGPGKSQPVANYVLAPNSDPEDSDEEN